MLSVLMVRAADGAGIEASRAARPDILVLDGVPPGAPSGSALPFVPEEAGPHPQIFVRIGSLHSESVGAELEAALAAGAQGMVLPGAVGRRSVEHLGAKLAVLEAERGIAVGRTRIIPVVDSAEGALAIASLALGGQRLAGLAWDEEAIRSELGLPEDRSATERDPAPFLLIRATLVLAARAAGVPAVDGPYTGLRDGDGPASDLRRARQDGFAGKMATGPEEIPAIRSA